MRKLLIQILLIAAAAIAGYLVGQYRERERGALTVSGILWAMPPGCAEEVDKVFHSELEKIKKRMPKREE